MVSFLNQIQTPLRTSSTEIERAFGELDAHLNLDPVERLEAITFHNKLTEKLKADGIISSAFLQGSFARKTMLSPIRDIDKVFLVSSLYKSWLSDKGSSRRRRRYRSRASWALPRRDVQTFAARTADGPR